MFKLKDKSLKSLLILSIILHITSLSWLGMELYEDVRSSNAAHADVRFVMVEPPKLEIENEEPEEVEIDTPKISTPEPNEIINNYVREICSMYNMEPELIMSVITHESDYDPEAAVGNCVGLMQVSTRWHEDRAERLGVTDFYDPYSNILLGVDYLSELLKRYEDPELVLMLYNMKHDTAFKLYNEGKISKYAKSVLVLAESFKKGA